MMSCAGNKYLKTPAMDSLAAGGIRFEKVYCSNPVCVPSRVAMVTGRMPSTFGMQDNKELDKTRISDAVLSSSMGSLLQGAGYETVYGGKTHVPDKIQDYGFSKVLTKDQRVELAKECAGYLRRPHDTPFLLVASFINPHDICYMALNADKRARNVVIREGPHQLALAEAMLLPAGVSEDEFYRSICPPLRANFEPPAGAPEAITKNAVVGFRAHVFANWTEKDWRLHRWAYCRLTERVDSQIGTVLEALRESGLEDNTVVIFTSDHGDQDSAHRLEHKSVLYEEATRVPFIMAYKGHIAAGALDRTHLVSSGLDLIPTMCDYAGVKPPPDMRGRSLRDLAEGRAPREWRGSVVVETNYGRMVCTGDYKYCVYDSGNTRESLVDLRSDPGEMKNVAGAPEYREVVEKHRKLMAEWVRDTADRFAAKYVTGIR